MAGGEWRVGSGARVHLIEHLLALFVVQQLVAPDELPVRVQHLVNDAPVVRPEGEVADREEGRALEPLLDEVVQRIALLALLHCLRVPGVQVGAVVAPAVRQPHLLRQPQRVLDQPELHGLEARGGEEEVAELQEAHRGHGLEHGELRHEDPLDLRHALQPLHGDAHVLLVDVRRTEDVDDAVDLVQHLLEPELVRLVDDDEEVLVMRLVRGVGLGAARRLRVEDLAGGAGRGGAGRAEAAGGLSVSGGGGRARWQRCSRCGGALACLLPCSPASRPTVSWGRARRGAGCGAAR